MKHIVVCSVNLFSKTISANTPWLYENSVIHIPVWGRIYGNPPFAQPALLVTVALDLRHTLILA